MHAGEALWNLCALVAYAERGGTTDDIALKLTGIGRGSCHALSEFLGVPLPTDEQLQARLDALQPTRPIPPAPVPSGIAHPALREEKIAAIAKHVRANANRIQELFKEHPDLERCASTLLSACKLAMWATGELGTFGGMTNELVQQTHESMRLAAITKEVDYPELLSQLRGKDLAFFEQRIKEYEAGQKASKPHRVRKP